MIGVILPVSLELWTVRLLAAPGSALPPLLDQLLTGTEIGRLRPHYRSNICKMSHHVVYQIGGNIYKDPIRM